MLNLNEVLTCNPGIVTRQSGNELVVVLPESGKFFVLNGLGAEVMQLLDGVRALAEVAETLAARYPDVAVERIQADVLAFSEKMLERQVCRRSV